MQDALSKGYTINQGGGGAYEEHFAEAEKGSAKNLLYENHFRIRKLATFMQSELNSGRPTKNAYFGSEFSSVLYQTNQFLFLKNFRDRCGHSNIIITNFQKRLEQQL